MKRISEFSVSKVLCLGVQLCCLTIACLVANTAAAQESAAEAAPSVEGVTSAAGATQAAAEKAEVPAVGNTEGPAVSEIAVAPAEPEVELPFSVQPYLVSIEVSFEIGCISDSSQRALIVSDIANATERMFGRMWQPEVVQSDWFVSGDHGRLERIKVQDLLERYPEQEFQKAFLLTVESQGAGYEVCCREYDSRVQELTPVFSVATLDVRSIGEVSAELLRDAFRPCVLFVRNFETEDRQNRMELHVQAGEILPPDPSAVQVVEGDVLRPFIRQMDRRNPKKLSQLRAMTLSYVKVLRMGPTEVPAEPTNASQDDFPEFTVLNDDGSVSEHSSPEESELGRSIVTGVYLTHLSVSPFGGKGRRMEHFALRQRPTASESRVKLVLQSRPDKPLISHRLALAYQLGYKDEEEGPQTQLVSDRNGEVIIRIKEDHPTFWIRVYSGASLLARVPYAPGLIPFDTIELPDDSIRLGVEGEIQLLSDQLIDSITLRGVLVARARNAAEAGDRDEVKALMTRYEEVPAKTFFLEKISNVKNLAEKQARDRRQNPMRITKLCTGLSDTVSAFFSDQKRAERTEEIQKIRQTAERNAK